MHRLGPSVARALLALAAAPLGCDRAAPRFGDAADGVTLRDTPRPRAMTATVDTAARASAIVLDVAGGTISAATEDFAYQLTVPPNAIVGSRRITLTPLTAASGLPGDAPLVAGVRLEPSGLRFLRPVTLDVIPLRSRALGRVVALASRDGGADLHRYPAKAQDGALSLGLVHFSEYVLADGGAATAQEAMKWPPRDAEAQFEQRLASILDGERARVQAQGDESSLPADAAHDAAVHERIVAEFRDHWQRVVRPKLLAATTDENRAFDAITEFLGWMRRAQLLIGGPEGEVDRLFATESAEGTELMRKVIRNAFEKAAKRCEEKADFSQIAKILGIARFAQLVGAPELVEDADERLKRCTEFELSFESFTSQDLQSGGSLSGLARNRVRAVVPLTFDQKTGRLHGTAPLEALEATMKNFRGFGMPCVANSTGERGNGVFTVFDGTVNMDRLRDSTKADAPPDVVLYVDPGKPKAGIATRCNGVSIPSRFDDAPYPWEDFHRELRAPDEVQEHFQSADVYAVTDWEAGPPGVIARKVFDRAWDTPDAHHVERTVFELRRPLVR